MWAISRAGYWTPLLFWNRQNVSVTPIIKNVKVRQIGVLVYLIFYLRMYQADRLDQYYCWYWLYKADWVSAMIRYIDSVKCGHWLNLKCHSSPWPHLINTNAISSLKWGVQLCIWNKECAGNGIAIGRENVVSVLPYLNFKMAIINSVSSS